MKEKRKDKVVTFATGYSQHITHPVPNPARRGLTWVALLKKLTREFFWTTSKTFVEKRVSME